MTKASRRQLLVSVKYLLSSGAYSDFDITCGSDIYHAHRSIVCPRAKFFACAVQFPGFEVKKKVDLSVEEPTNVKLLMQYLYEGDYAPVLTDSILSANFPQTYGTEFGGKAPISHTCFFEQRAFGNDFTCAEVLCDHHTCGNQCGHEFGSSRCVDFICSTCHLPAPVSPPVPPGTQPADLLTHAKMYDIAGRLIVTGLKALARTKFKHACTHYWNTPEFSIAAEYVFASTPHNDKCLRDIVCNTISNNMRLMKEPTIKKILMENNGFAYALLEEKAVENKWM